jgi:hypothetical protein
MVYNFCDVLHKIYFIKVFKKINSSFLKSFIKEGDKLQIKCFKNTATQLMGLILKILILKSRSNYYNKSLIVLF